MNKTMQRSVLPIAALAGVLLAGCSKDASAPEPAATLPVKKKDFVVNAAAGVPVTQSTDAKKFTALVASNSARYGMGRPDPFALTRDDQSYELNQATEKVFQASGFSSSFEVPADTETVPPITEPQPYRRLSGVVVGDSVLAILDMGDGSQPQIIRPGMKIPNSPWTVVSIDSEKAVLHRSGNVLPTTVVVRLESPPPGMGGATASGFNSAGAGAGGFTGPKAGVGGGGAGPGAGSD